MPRQVGRLRRNLKRYIQDYRRPIHRPMFSIRCSDSAQIAVIRRNRCIR